MTKNIIFITFLLIASFSFSQTEELVLENNETTKEGDIRKHKGFYLSMSLGLGGSTIQTDVVNISSSEMNGASGVFDLKIGGTIRENLILHGTIRGVRMVGPEVTQGGVTTKLGNHISVQEVFIGPGITYYLAQPNIFFSGSIGFGGFSTTEVYENGATTTTITTVTDPGVGLQLKIGKEWWISNRWALGVAVSISGLNVNNKTEVVNPESIDSGTFAIHFNATLQ